MRLFHGSNVEVRRPRLLESQRGLDFGNGFYTTSCFEQASAWAIRSARIRKAGTATVSVYDVRAERFEELQVLRFSKPDEQWLSFIVNNRRGIASNQDWDIVMGPVANDQTWSTIILFMDGFLNEQETIRRLLPQKLKDQITFKTQKSLDFLKCVEVIKV